MGWVNELDAELSKDVCVGFVYEIRENNTGKYYVGIKKFWYDAKLKPLKGMKNKRHSKKETDWREYNSSNKILQEKIKLNPENYTKYILRFCKTISEMKAYEAYLQLDEYINGDWNNLYNEMINLRLRLRK